MATITFLGESFEVDHAVKGEDYVHGYDAAGHCIISIDGVKDFSLITYDGVYMNPRECLSEPCNSVKYCGGSLKTADGEMVSTCKVLWENADKTSSFPAQTITVPNLGDYDLFMMIFQVDKTENWGLTDFSLEVPVGGTAWGYATKSRTITSTHKTEYRQVNIDRSENTITFGAGYYGSLASGKVSSDTSQNVMIPNILIGFKVER